MSVQWKEERESNVVEVTASGQLTKEDYEQFVPIIERRISEQEKVRLLFRMRDFHGWKVTALWEDLRFDVRHFRDIERLAIVGDRAREHGMAQFCKSFTTAAIRYLEPEQEQEARAWLST